MSRIEKLIFCLPLLFLVVAFTTVASKAYAFSIAVVNGNPVRWTISEVGYYLDQDGWSGITDGSDLQAVEDSFADWEAVECSYLKFNKLGSTNVNDVLSTGAAGNYKNEVIWKEGYWPYGNYVLGVTAPLFGYDGVIIEADIAFNGTITWKTTGGSVFDAMDVKSVAIHEIGHFFGLQHVLQYDESNPPTMAPVVDPWGKTATLEEDDKKGICFLYPAGGTWVCYGEDDCPYVVDEDSSGQEYYSAKYQCDNGTCTLNGTVPTGGGKLGDPCYAASDCSPPYFCVQSWSGNFCTQFCSDPVGGSGCPSGYVCVPLQGAEPNQGACAPGSGGEPTPQLKENGEPCESSSECKSGLCFADPTTYDYRCRQPCTVNGSDCPSGYKCIPAYGDMSGTKGACIPEAQLPQKPEGVPCKANWECASGYCYYDPDSGIAVCRSKCQPSLNNCPAGRVCVETGDGGVCLPKPKPEDLKDDGEFCIHDYECKGGYCAPVPGLPTRKCATECSPEKPCPTGYTCIYIESSSKGMCAKNKKPVGEVCSDATECTSMICWAPQGVMPHCLLPCVAGQCPTNYTCYYGTPYGDVCLEGADGSGFQPGVSCLGDYQCNSGLCINNICRQACDVLQPNCPAGTGCVPVANDNSGACVTPGQKPIGSQCSSDYECQTLFCVQPPGYAAPTCLQPCNPALNNCSNGQVCQAIPGMVSLGACIAPQSETNQQPQQTQTNNQTNTNPQTEVQSGGSAGSSGCAIATPNLSGWLLVLFALMAFLVSLRRTNSKEKENI